MKNNNKKSQFFIRAISLLWWFARIPAQIPIVLGLLLACVMIWIGKFGELLSDTLDDLNHSLCMATSPKAWNLMIELKQERDDYRNKLSFVEHELERLRKPSETCIEKQ